MPHLTLFNQTLTKVKTKTYNYKDVHRFDILHLNPLTLYLYPKNIEFVKTNTYFTEFLHR